MSQSSADGGAVTAIFGGSFNPPHLGHAMVAAWLKWTGRADDVWFVPAFEHAFGKPLAPFENRLAALHRLTALLNPPQLPQLQREDLVHARGEGDVPEMVSAVVGDPGGERGWAGVSALERDLARPSYTIRTLDALQGQFPGRRFRLVVGADVWAQMPMWKEHERVRKEYAPIVVGRAGHPEVPGVPTFPGISSTAIREAIGRGEDVSGWVPAMVLRAWEGG